MMKLEVQHTSVNVSLPVTINIIIFNIIEWAVVMGTECVSEKVEFQCLLIVAM